MPVMQMSSSPPSPARGKGLGGRSRWLLSIVGLVVGGVVGASVLVARGSLVLSECARLERTWGEELRKQLDDLEPIAAKRLSTSTDCDTDDDIVFVARIYGGDLSVDAAVTALAKDAAQKNWKVVDLETTDSVAYLCAERRWRGVLLNLGATSLLPEHHPGELAVTVSLPPADYGSECGQ